MSTCAVLFFTHASLAATDIVADGCVNVLDYETQQQSYHKTAAGDTDGDGQTNLKDVAAVMHDWKTGCVDNAQIVTQSTPPDALAKTSHQTMNFTIKNTGNTVWSQAENYAIIQAHPQSTPNDPYDPTAWGPQYFTISQTRVLPGQSFTMSINLTAPSNPGTYPMIFRMANVSQPLRFGEYTQEKKVSVYDPTKPNIVLLLTDDLNNEDWNHIQSDFAPLLQNKGLTFNNFIISTPLCCPSRTSFLRGQYSQNTGIYTNGDNGITPTTTATNSSLDYHDLDFVSPSLSGDFTSGGWQSFHAFGEESSTVATWVHDRGYKTMLAGKYLNKYDSSVGAGTTGQDDWYTPPGWDIFDAMVNDIDHVSNSLMSQAQNGHYVTFDGDVGKTDPSQYTVTLTRTITAQAQDMIRNVGNQPFFLFLTPHAPHGPVDCIAPYSKDQFTDPLPQTPNFNEADVSDKPQWVQNLPLWGSAALPNELAQETDWYHARLCTMKQIRDQVSDVINTLTETGKINNTYIMFVSDNGYHMGQHRMTRSKNTMYEEDIRVPFVIRGPGIPQGQSINHLVTNVDFAATVADLAGATPASFTDGKSFAPLLSSNIPSVDAWRKQVFLTTTGTGGLTYGVRTKNMMYNKIEATGEEELYDLVADPYELQNLANNSAFSSTKANLANKLAALKGCAAQACRDAELLP